jgi:cell wall-associated NlpC family hydrolase
MRISGPSGTVAPGTHTIGVRLLTGARYYPNRYVHVQKTTAKGWVPVGRMLTDANGLARGRFSFGESTRVRAVYQAGATSTAATSPEHAMKVSASAASFRTRAVQVAAAQQGKPYRYGSTGPNSFDCSGLVGYAFRAAGKNLPRTSGAIRNATKQVSRAAAVPGDLIWSPGHIGIYAGNGKMIDAPRAGKPVALRAIYQRSYEVRRVV